MIAVEGYTFDEVNRCNVLMALTVSWIATQRCSNRGIQLAAKPGDVVQHLIRIETSIVRDVAIRKHAMKVHANPLTIWCGAKDTKYRDLSKCLPRGQECTIRTIVRAWSYCDVVNIDQPHAKVRPFCVRVIIGRLAVSSLHRSAHGELSL